MVRGRGVDLSLQAILDPRFVGGRSLARVLGALVRGGVGVVQMREKGVETRVLLEKAILLREITHRLGVPLLINDRVDIALVVDADGVHLGQHDLPARLARKVLGPRKTVGVSTHNLKEALQAERDGADYISVGSIFPTDTKRDTVLVGPAMISGIHQRVGLPIVAIGGIKPENAGVVIKAGASGVAAISGLIGVARVEYAARQYRIAINEARGW